MALPILMNDGPILIERQLRSVPSLIWLRQRSTTSSPPQEHRIGHVSLPCCPDTSGKASDCVYATLHSVGIGRLCFEIDDIFEAARLLEENKVPFSEDPEGTVLEFIQFKRQSSMRDRRN